MLKGNNTKVHRTRIVPNKNTQLVVGSGNNMQFNPSVFKTWQEDACDADDWKHGRISDTYRNHYERIFGHA